MATQQERTRAARQTIIDAAVQIISDEGYAALTMTGIEAASGSSRGLVGYHFGSKQGLLVAVIDQVRATFVERVVNSPATALETGLEGTSRVMRTYLAELLLDARRNRVMLILIVESLGAQPVLQESVRDLNALLRGSLAEHLHRGHHDGSVPTELDTDSYAVVLAATLRGIVLQWVADPARVDLAAAGATALDTFARACADTSVPADRGRRPA